MYNPDACSDTYCEWIELYNNGSFSVNLSAWKIDDNPFDDINITPYEYMVIARNKEKYEEFFGNNDSIWNGSDKNYSVVDGSFTLKNSGDTISLSNETDSYNVTYTNIATPGNSIELVSGTWIESFELGGTPGRKNTGIIVEDNETNTSQEVKLDVDIDISSENLSLGETLNITGKITNLVLIETNANLTIKIAKKIGSSWKYKWFIIENYPMNISNITTINYNWTLPNDLIKGDYKVLATLKYLGTNTRSDQKFFVNGLDDLGEHNLTIISIPNSIRFGDFTTIFVKFDSNNYDFEALSFVPYLYSPRWATIDLDDNTLRTRPYETNVAVNLENISRGTTTYLSLPLFSKRNCDSDFDSGNYKGKVRVYAFGEDIITEGFEIKLIDTNDAMCPKTITKYKSSGSSDSPIVVNPKQEKNSFTHDEVKFIIQTSENISREFEVKVKLENPTVDNKEFEMWSYIYSGSLALMKREENKEKIVLNSKQTKEITLNNKITRDEIPVKDYKIMVKIKSPNRESAKTYSTPVNLMISESKAKNKIKSFYTRAKKFNDKINLYAGCAENNMDLVLETSKKAIKKSCDKTVSFEVEIEDGPNLFFLSLSDNKTIHDTRKLLVLANKTGLTSYSDSFKIYDIINTYSNIKEPNGKTNLITGQAVNKPVTIYESSNIKLKKLIKYLLSSLFVVGIIMFIVRRNGE